MESHHVDIHKAFDVYSEDVNAWHSGTEADDEFF